MALQNTSSLFGASVTGLVSSLEFMAVKIILGVLVLLVLVLIIRDRQMNLQILKLTELLQNGEHLGNPPRLRMLSNFHSIKSLLAALETSFEKQTEEIGGLRKSDRELHRMVTNLSHDMRTPLTVLLAHAENLATAYPDNCHTQRIIAKGKELVTLIDRFFDLSKLESEEVEFTLLTLDLSEQVRQAVLESYDAIENAGLEPTFEIPDEPIEIQANPMGLNRCLQNLITNAINYGAEGGIIGIKAGRENSGGWVTVWDKGPGIPPSQIELIFERTYTLDDSRNSRSSGLGLSIVKTFMKRMHGHVEVSSHPDKGTAFTLHFPSGSSQ
jgi:signal transduction histidine kinase